MNGGGESNRLRVALGHYAEVLRELSRIDRDLPGTAGCVGDRGGPILFLVSDGVFWFRSRSIRCTALVGRAGRCRRPVFDEGEVWRWRGPFAEIEDSWIGRLLSQTCRIHDDGRGNYAPPDWYRIPIDPSMIADLPKAGW